VHTGTSDHVIGSVEGLMRLGMGVGVVIRSCGSMPSALPVCVVDIVGSVGMETTWSARAFGSCGGHGLPVAPPSVVVAVTTAWDACVSSRLHVWSMGSPEAGWSKAPCSPALWGAVASVMGGGVGVWVGW
jgi:hypothetical protein